MEIIKRIPLLRNITSGNVASLLLLFSMFMTGAAGLVSEYVLGTVSAYILGNTIVQLTIVIAVMMLMMGIGNFAQKFLSDEKLIEKFIGVEIMMAILAGFAPMAMFTAFAHITDHFLLIEYSLISSIGFLIGFEIPLVTRINEHYQPKLKTNLGNTLFADYVGAFVGCLIWIWLLRRVSLVQIGFIVGTCNLLVAILTYSYFYRLGLVTHKKSTLTSITLTIAVLAFGWANQGTWNKHLEQRLYDDNIVVELQTPYQRGIVTKYKDDYRFYINGNLQFSSRDEHIYHEQLVHPVMTLVPDHSRVLILGGGDGLALREVLKYKDVGEVLLVDLDPGLTNAFANNKLLANLNGNSFADARVHVKHTSALSEGSWKTIRQETGDNKKGGKEDVVTVASVRVRNIDADRFLREITGFWDVIIIDFPDPNSIELAKLYSKDFFVKLRRVLSKNGMFVIQSTSPYYAKEAFLCIKRTIMSSGFASVPYQDHVPSFGNWGWILGASLDEASLQTRLDNLDQFHVETKYLTPRVFQSARVFGKGMLNTKDTRISTWMNPVILDLYTHQAWKYD